MITAGAFVAAAIAGTLLRWGVGAALPRPAGTWAVNVVGAFALGAIDGWAGPAATVVGVGLLGSLTTFSTLAGQVVDLGADDPGTAGRYVAVTVVGGVLAATLGLALAP